MFLLKKKDRSCLRCGKGASKTCARCKAVAYCSRECQKKDWKQHKVTCGKLGKGQTPEAAAAGTASDPLKHAKNGTAHPDPRPGASYWWIKPLDLAHVPGPPHGMVPLTVRANLVTLSRVSWPSGVIPCPEHGDHPPAQTLHERELAMTELHLLYHSGTEKDRRDFATGGGCGPLLEIINRHHACDPELDTMSVGRADTYHGMYKGERQPSIRMKLMDLAWDLCQYSVCSTDMALMGSLGLVKLFLRKKDSLYLEYNQNMGNGKFGSGDPRDLFSRDKESSPTGLSTVMLDDFYEINHPSGNDLQVCAWALAILAGLATTPFRNNGKPVDKDEFQKYALLFGVEIWKEMGAVIESLPAKCSLINQQLHGSALRFASGILQIRTKCYEIPHPGVAKAVVSLTRAYDGRIPCSMLAMAYDAINKYRKAFPNDESGVTKADLSTKEARNYIGMGTLGRSGVFQDALQTVASRNMQLMNGLGNVFANQNGGNGCAQQ